ncbi:MAG: divalent metal cation transporter [Saprospiraceae bacterium]
MNKFLKTLGPGILFASTAIGVSHLVQSTRAGAEYGFTLLWAVILANVLKFPFFEYGSRYANITGTSLIDGYKKMGKWMLYLYFIITISTMFFVTAAVGAVTAGFMDNLFGFSKFIDFKMFPVILVFIITMAILFVGRFNLLDNMMKIIALILFISTFIAFFIAIFRGPTADINDVITPDIWEPKSVAFIIALMGWMPTALDLSTWNSLWTIEKIKQSGYKPTLKETLREYNLGYWISAILSVCFLTLGAFLIFGTGIKMPDSGALFANKVISLYTSTIGKWSYWIIAASGFSIMFGTVLGLFDGYARALERASQLIFFNNSDIKKDKVLYSIAVAITGIGGFLVIIIFSGNQSGFKALVDFATTLSFVVAPVVAVVNYRLVTSKNFPAEGRPGFIMHLLSVTGIVFLTGFTIYYLWFIL